MPEPKDTKVKTKSPLEEKIRITHQVLWAVCGYLVFVAVAFLITTPKMPTSPPSLPSELPRYLGGVDPSNLQSELGNKHHPYLYFDAADIETLLAKQDFNNTQNLFTDWYQRILDTTNVPGQGNSDPDFARANAFIGMFYDDRYEHTDNNNQEADPAEYLQQASWWLARNDQYGLDYINDSDHTGDNNLSYIAKTYTLVYDIVKGYDQINGTNYLNNDEESSARERLYAIGKRLYDFALQDVDSTGKFVNFDPEFGTCEERGEGYLFCDWIYNNHHSGHNSALALVAMTLASGESDTSKQDEYQSWFDTALNHLYEMFSYDIVDAPYFEGSHYTDVFINLSFINFALAYKHALGVDVFADTRVPLVEMFHSTLVKQLTPNKNTDPSLSYHKIDEFDSSHPDPYFDFDTPPPTNYDHYFIHITKDLDMRAFYRLLVPVINNLNSQKAEEMNWALEDPAQDSTLIENNNVSTDRQLSSLILPYIFYDDSLSFNQPPSGEPTQFMTDNSEAVFRNSWDDNSSFLHLYGSKILRGHHGHSDITHFNLYADKVWWGVPKTLGEPGNSASGNVGDQRACEINNLVGVRREDGILGYDVKDSDPLISKEITTPIIECAVDGQTIHPIDTILDPSFLDDYFTTSFLDTADIAVNWHFNKNDDTRPANPGAVLQREESDLNINGDIAETVWRVFEIGDVSQKRTILYPNDYFIIIDDLESDNIDGYDYQWYFHYVCENADQGECTDGIGKNISGNQAEFKQINIDGDEVRLNVFMAAPEDVAFEDIPAYPPDEYINLDQSEYIQASHQAQNTQFLAIFHSRNVTNGEQAPTFKRLTTTRYTNVDSAEITLENGIEDIVYTQPENNLVNVSDISSNAKIGFRRKNNGKLDYFVFKEGTNFDIEGTNYFTSSQNTKAVGLQYQSDKAKGYIVNTNAGNNLGIYVDSTASEVMFNGSPIENFVQNGNVIQFSVSSSGSLEIIYGTPQSSLNITLTGNPSVPQGDALQLTTTIKNNSSEIQTVDIWYDLTPEGGQTKLDPLPVRNSLVLPPNTTSEFIDDIPIPQDAQLGSYTFFSYVGPDSANREIYDDSDDHVFEVTGKYSPKAQELTNLNIAGSSEKLWMEAENGELVPNMEEGLDPEASQGVYIVTPTGGMNGPGEAQYTLNIPQTDDYVIWGRAQTPSTGADSFYLQLDQDEEHLWDVFQYYDVGFYNDAWGWDQVSSRGNGTFDNPEVDPLILNISRGSHTLTIKNRENNTKLDKLLITNDLDYIPNGIGG